MPLPFIPLILGGISAAAAVHGVKKGMEAKETMDDAKDYNNQAKKIVEAAQSQIELYQEDAKSSIEDLGEEKIEILGGSINDFVTTFERIKEVQLQSSNGIDELRNFNPQSENFKRLKSASFEAKDIVLNGLGSLAGGTLLALGTYNLVMGGAGGLLVTATTGTALASLTGAAATNATLAWLGGGALAAGGLGMAGGMAVLGGLVAGPALALGGSMLASKADEAYWDARSNLEEAKTFNEQSKNICSTLEAIEDRAFQLYILLSDLDNLVFMDLIDDMKETIEYYGTNWSSYPDENKRQIQKCVEVALVIKMILDTSLLSEDGKLLSQSKWNLEKGQKMLDEFTA